MRTVDDILNLLSAHKGNFQLIAGLIRHKTMRQGNLEGKPDAGIRCCPLNVLCGGKFYNGDLEEMRSELNMSRQDAVSFVEAADRYGSLQLRERILEVLGL